MIILPIGLESQTQATLQWRLARQAGSGPSPWVGWPAGPDPIPDVSMYFYVLLPPLYPPEPSVRAAYGTDKGLEEQYPGEPQFPCTGEVPDTGLILVGTPIVSMEELEALRPENDREEIARLQAIRDLQTAEAVRLRGDAAAAAAEAEAAALDATEQIEALAIARDIIAREKDAATTEIARLQAKLAAATAPKAPVGG